MPFSTVSGIAICSGNERSISACSEVQAFFENSSTTIVQWNRVDAISPNGFFFLVLGQHNVEVMSCGNVVTTTIFLLGRDNAIAAEAKRWPGL